jgi:hypothetical protein
VIMVSDYKSHVHRILKKSNRLKTLCLSVLSFALLLVIWVSQPHKAFAGLGDLLSGTLPTVSQPTSGTTPAPQQTAAPQQSAGPQQAASLSLPDVTVPAADLNVPALEVNIPETVIQVPAAETIIEVPQDKLELPKVELTIPIVPGETAESGVDEIKIWHKQIIIPKVQPLNASKEQANVLDDNLKLFEAEISTPEQSNSPEPIDPTSQPVPTAAVTASPKPWSAIATDPEPAISKKSAPVINKPVSRTLKKSTWKDPGSVKETAVPLPAQDQRPYRLPIEAIWASPSAANGIGTLMNNGQAGLTLPVYDLNDLRLMNDSSSSRVYCTIFAKSDQWAQAPPGLPPKDFSSQPKKSK